MLIPSNSKPDMTLEWNPGGVWMVPAATVEVSKVMSLVPEDTQVNSGEIEVILLLNTVYTGDPLGLDTLPLTIRVNGNTATFDSVDEYYEAAGLHFYGDLGDGNGDILMVYSAVSFDDPVPDGTYDIEIIVPGTDTASGADISASCTLTVGDSAPAVKTIPIPKANTGLKWTGAEQTGVNEGTGYTLSGDFKATAVGSYTATAALKSGYQWTGGSTDPQSISWRIAKANGPAAPTGLAGTAPTTAGGADGKITGTTAAMEYAANQSFTNPRACGDSETVGLSAGTYYVRAKETSTHEAGASASITVPAPGAATVTGISVSSAAHKTEYTVGESLDVTGLTIETVYSDGYRRTVPVTADMISGFDSSAPAESQTLTITYEGKSASYTVRITAGQQPGETKYQVTVSNTGDGGTSSGVHMYEAGTEVIIRAGSKSGFTFAAWETAGMTLIDHSVPEISFTMPANAVTLHAVWTPDSITPPDGHTHAWSTAWQFNYTHHWHNCAASDCPVTQDSQKSGYAAHTAGEWVADRPATSSQSGSRYRSCTVCGYEIIRETIPAAGSSSSSGGSGTTVKHPDGSITSTSTNKTTGTVTETTRRPDGSKTVVETQRDGTVTTTDTAKDGSTVKTVARPDGSVETAIKQASGLTASVQTNRNGAKADVLIPSRALDENPRNSAALPIPALPGENAFVTVHTASARPVSVEIPVYGNENTTVACLVNPDGSEAILKTAMLSGGQMIVSVSNGATVHIRDNGKNFQDIQGHWARSAIDFVSARELFSGKTSSAFVPDASMSRAMLMTVLARLDGLDAAGESAYEKGMTWAVARGISDGRNPDSRVTREQFVTMLHRYAGSPAATDQELHFSGTEKISAYAQEAVRWAVENGILGGYGDGSLLLNGRTTRAQAAVMLERYAKYLNRQ